jgi:hypothetical protein
MVAVSPRGYAIKIAPMTADAEAILRALNRMWAAIREQDSRVPAVVFSLAGRTSSCNSVAWDLQPVVELSLRDADARDILETLLHQAAHAVSRESTGSEGRYHDQRFAEAARGIGLKVSTIRRAGLGYQPEGLARGTLARYQEQGRDLAKALNDWHPAEPPRSSSRTYLLLTCSCDPPRKMRMSPGVAERGPVVCSVCGQEFSASASA